jgi:hypothetical protein
MGLRTRCIARSLLVMAVIGTLSAAQQVSAQSVFGARGAGTGSLSAAPSLAFGSSGFHAAGAPALGYASTPGDTVETLDIQVEEDKGPSLWKQLVVFGVITAVVAYSVIALMGSNDETPPEDTGGSGKPTPVRVPGSAIAIPLTR